jgi:riboflavin synthase
VSDAGIDWFEVSLIPETLAATTLGTKVVGDEVNIETDILARQIQRMVQFAAVADDTQSQSSVREPIGFSAGFSHGRSES